MLSKCLLHECTFPEHLSSPYDFYLTGVTGGSHWEHPPFLFYNAFWSY